MGVPETGDVMQPFEWKPEYSVDNPKIDAQHQQLLQLANLLIDAVRRGKGEAVTEQAFQSLLAYTTQHFQDEEAHFELIASSLLEHHKAKHIELAHEIQELWEAYHAGGLDDPEETLLDWIENRLIDQLIHDDQDAARAQPL